MNIEREDIERLKEIFVTRQECDTNMDGLQDKVEKENVKLAVIEQRLSTISWVLYAVAGGIIATIIKLFFGG
jgi:hypothetical protein